MSGVAPLLKLLLRALHDTVTGKRTFVYCTFDSEVTLSESRYHDVQ